ncbi:(2Fe-2S)-binding protein [Frankia sp. QA3]|uniref:(2Fe-2S)-binding protein n=1 Tax=Frankia sp. QA3 TaxID=710111 RepID=UPI000269C2C3|nr:(2Fe-2S)-binding protein [Frankia sp. QA3]EIV91088.1 putative Fe-S protein [Frankia sp. QA3]
MAVISDPDDRRCAPPTEPPAAGGEAIRVARVDPGHAARVLRGLDELGPPFAVQIVTGAGDPATATGGLLPAADLYRPGDRLAAAIEGQAAALGGAERRVAASNLFIGHAIRLWCVTLGCWERGGLIPDLPVDAVLAVGPGSRAPLALADTGGWRPADPGDVDTVAALVTRVVIDGHLRPFAAAMHATIRTATGLLWGNAASALVGAVGAIARHATLGPAAPSDAPSGGPVRHQARLAATLLEQPPLAGTGVHRRHDDGNLDLPSFVRRSCCLYYRLPDGAMCEDCSLRDSPAATRRHSPSSAPNAPAPCRPDGGGRHS